MDDNFCYPLPNALENDRVKLVPFIPSEHAQAVFDAADSAVWTYVAAGPFKSAQDYLEVMWLGRLYPRSGDTLFVIYDKASNSIAGTISYINSSAPDLVTEIGFVIIFSKFHRTYVAANAVGLMMKYALDLPERGGLGLRRVEWRANKLNIPSVKLAEKMGFEFEGVLRCHHVLPVGKDAGHNGVKIRKGDPREDCSARDTALLAACWDRWENGGREKVDEVMARR